MDVDMDRYNLAGPNASHERLLKLQGIKAAEPSDWPSMLLEECLNGSFETFFSSVPVRRDSEPAQVEGLPETVIKLAKTPGVKGLLDDIQCYKQILVRDEYLWALNDAQAACYKRETKFHTPSECIHPKVQYRSVTEVPSPSPPVFSHNPFDDLRQVQDFYGKNKAFMIIGYPGIGKTAFLPIIVVLRCLARRVTFLQTKQNEMWMFYPFLRTVYVLRTEDIRPTQLRELLPQDTWALIDSNDDISSVPSCITSMRTFVIQATSARVFRTEWAPKRSYGAIRWYMASWTLGELICGRDFDPFDEDHHPTSEKDLEAFMAVCPPSARIAYSLQDEHFDFKKHVSSYRLGGAMTLQRLARLLSDDPEFDKDDTTSHHVLAITPGPIMYHLLRDKLRAGGYDPYPPWKMSGVAVD
ncbi:hypothetical protein GGX14DRAFT_478718 [Mycena pura]|uniref:Crinkler (CRN) family protein n=1 Tax=Mycena pura TaxID=153505 RepID=A0AAD6US10_9AGAR|nr:hypothetical protein GGX14DRAFT_478718 [Mycena pura]